MGPKASAVCFEQILGQEEDCYELMQKGSKVLIRGNNANPMAVGLNNPVELPDVMPRVPEPVRASAEMPVRFFLNYCTFGYTMPWQNCME